jgi:two-component system, chemotaxis family, response regulator Rcp1
MNATLNELSYKPIDILLVDDDEGDVLLTKKALHEGKLCNVINVARDGVEALAFLRRDPGYETAPRPDLIFLDLNMPRKDGREVLEEIKQDDNLRTIPVVVLTTSDADQDILHSYHLHANCYVTKPVGMEQFISAVHDIHGYWLSVVKLPPR